MADGKFCDRHEAGSGDIFGGDIARYPNTCWRCRMEQRLAPVFMDLGFGPSCEPRWRYFESRDKWIFGWTTERTGRGFTTLIYKPTGKGSRSGKPQNWELVKTVDHKERQRAKALALKLRDERDAELSAAS